jgi:taurine dioxygenase
MLEQRRSTESAFTFVPASPHIGARVMGSSLADVMEAQDQNALADLRDALDTHLILHFSGQTLQPRQIEDLGRHFGPLLSLKRPENKTASHLGDVEFLKIITNALTPDGKPLGDGSNASQDWHTDGAMKPRPATYSYFYARTVPRVPPKTYWMNAYRVYESLPQSVKDKIHDLYVIHHHYTAGNEFPLPPSLPLTEREKGPRHPLVRVHPATGKPILYLPHRRDALVVGYSPEESDELIGYLREFAANSPFWWGTAMQPDDFVIWDNRACLHRRDGWESNEDRIMWHLANEGETPIPLAG